MKTKISIFFIIAALLLTTAPCSFAQTSPNDWGAVQKLSAKTDLLVKTSNGKTFSGALVSVKDDEITLTAKGRDFILAKNNLEAIYFAVPKTGRRARNIGALIGAIVAGSTYAATAGDEGDSGTGSPILLFAAGGIAGGFVGSLFGKGSKKGVLIYKARQ